MRLPLPGGGSFEPNGAGWALIGAACAGIAFVAVVLALAGASWTSAHSGGCRCPRCGR